MTGFMFGRRPKPTEHTVDTSSRRSAVIRETTADHLVVDHFYHAGEFWTALIPTDCVENIYGLSFNFSKIKTRRGKVVFDERGQPKPRHGWINHVLCRFTLNKSRPVTLFPLFSDCQESSERTNQIHDFIYSVEATGPKGVPFDFRNGMAGTLLCTHRFLSTLEMVFERIVIQGHYVWQSPPLPLTEKEKGTVLLRSLQRSTKANMDEVYHLIGCFGTNNCTSNPFRILDESIDYSLRRWLASLLYRLPLNPRLYLRLRGLDSDPGEYKFVRNEFEKYVSDTETQRRKRTVIRRLLRERRDFVESQ